MDFLARTYRRFFGLLLGAVLCAGFCSQVGDAQTPGGTQLTAQGTGAYTYKKKPFSVSSPIVTVTVGNFPNFELHYAVKDSNVIFNDVVQLWLGFKNIGNATADTVTIQSILPQSGVSVVSASNGGVVQGNTITWKETAFSVAKQDSFLVRLQIDTTTKAQTVLTANALLSWQGNSVAAAQRLIVGNFARLFVSDSASTAMVGSGRTVDYALKVWNTGNVQSDSTILVDTISANGSFLRASVTPTSVSANQRIVTWNLGTLQPISGLQKIVLTVEAAPNLGFAQLFNAATARSSSVAPLSSGTVTTSIVPVRPAALSIALQQKYVFGSEGQDSSQITATVGDSLGNPIPDGVPVVFQTDHGMFYNKAKSITVLTIGGAAKVYLDAESVQNDIVQATVKVTAGTVQSGTISGSTSLILYPGAVTGVVRTTTVVAGVTQLLPYRGAIARVFNTTPALVGSDTTGGDGVFFIPLNKETTTYSLQISVVDQFGDTSSTSSGMRSDSVFGHKAVKFLNTISGRLQYNNGGSALPVTGVVVNLDSLTVNSKGESRMTRGVRAPFLAHRLQTTTTDNMGRYKFQNLQPAIYQVSVDSTKFPIYSGSAVVYDTTGGTFAINLNILIKPSAASTVAMSSVPTISAGDTLTYVVKYSNAGNVYQTHASLVDTLPKYVALSSVQRGGFATVTYDTARSILRVAMDTLPVSKADSVKVIAAVVRNVPDSTLIRNTSWLTSDQISPLASTAVTLVRSAPQMSLKNFVLESKDTVVAGDSVKFQIWYRNIGTDSLRHVEIVDSLTNTGRSLLRYKLWSGGAPVKDTAAVDSVVRWPIGSVPPGSVDSLTLFMKTDYALTSGKKIQSTAYLLQSGAAVATATASVQIRSNPQIANFLQVVKTADKNVAEIGDVVTYQVTITNTSAELMKDLTLIDQLPHDFKYFARSGRFNRAVVAPEVLSNGTVLRWTLSTSHNDTLGAGKSATLVYQLVLGADALESQGINTIYATAKDTVGTLFVSAPAEKQITVQPGVFTDQGIIIGKVFYDDDRNSYQSEGESGLKGVEIWMEDGTRITTGDDGKFSLPNVRPGQHVLRVNERTLPAGTELLKGNRDFAGDASSRFVRLPDGGIARADFYVKRLLRDSVHQRIGKIGKTAALRTATPEKIYLRDVPRGNGVTNVVQFDVSMNYSGSTWIQRIRVLDELPQGFAYVDGSGTFNGRNVAPVVEGEHLTWNLGRGASIFDGRLQYRVAVSRPEIQTNGLVSTSVVELMTLDSVVIRTDTLKTTTSVAKLSYTEKRFPVEPLVFNQGKSTLRKDALKIFQPIVALVRKYHYADIMLVGYPDLPIRKGPSVSFAKNLSEERARVALDFLSRRMKLDSVHITACSIFRCDTSAELLGSLMEGSSTPVSPRHLELRIQDYFEDALVARDTASSVSNISLVRTPPVSERQFSDSLLVIPGDDILFSYGIYSNPSVATVQATVVDSSAAGFAVEPESFTLNHIPVISAGEYGGVLSSSITLLLRRGKNEMLLRAEIPAGSADEKISHVLYLTTVNSFGEASVERSNPVAIYVRTRNLALLNAAVKHERELAGKESAPRPTTAK